MGWSIDRTKDGESMSQQRENEKLRKISQVSQVNSQVVEKNDVLLYLKLEKSFSGNYFSSMLVSEVDASCFFIFIVVYLSVPLMNGLAHVFRQTALIRVLQTRATWSCPGSCR